MTPFQRYLLLIALLFDSRALSFFSFTNLLYRIHWCDHPTPGPLGCGPPVCHDSTTLPQCNQDSSSGGSSGGSSSGGSGSSSSSGNGGSSGSSGSSRSGGGSSSSGGSSKSGGGSGNGSNGSSSINGSSSSNGSSSNGSSGGDGNGSVSYRSYNGLYYSDIADMCYNGGGCSGLFRYYCDDEGNCYYESCEEEGDECVYTCDAMEHCYQLCDKGESCGDDFFDYYNDEFGQGSSRRWTSATYLAVILVLLSLLAFAMCFAVSKRDQSEDGNGKNHPLKGSLGRRMKLFGRLAPRKPAPRDLQVYRKTENDGTIAPPPQDV